MRLINEERTERLLDRDGRRIEFIVRHRGIDVPTHRESFTMHHMIEQREPVAVVVDDGDTVRRISIEEHSMARRLAWLAPPMMALLVKLAMRRRRR